MKGIDDMKTMSEKSKQKMRETKLSKSKSFEQWCIENNRKDLLLRWDYELNDCSPSEISYGTDKKYWLKCNKHPEHKSELKDIHSFTNGQEGSIKCNQCNSIAQWFIDNNLDINDYWDYDKNTVDPWTISRGSKKKIWIKCQEKEYHGSYEIVCKNFTINNARCPYCCNHHGLVHPKDSLGQKIVDKYGEQYLRNIWSNKNEKSPFEIAPNSIKLFWWNCPDGKHEPYQKKANHMTTLEYRCSKCVEERKESIIEEKTRIYLQELNYIVKTEHNCSIRPINPKTKQKLLFDNEIILENGKHLIIEVHGEQHYKLGAFNNTKKELHYQQVKDRYKRIKCIQAGYEYLEIPYTAFDKKETYKKLIDYKIKEILEK